PTREERQRGSVVSGYSRSTKEEESSTQENAAKTRSTSQEDRYWSDQERRREASPQPAQPPYNPQTPGSSPGTQPQPEFDSRRAVEQAQMQDSDDFDGMPTASGPIGSMERISPEDLPGLIRARSEQQIPPGLGGSMSQPTIPDSSRLPNYTSPAQQCGESLGGRPFFLKIRHSPSQRASLDARRDRMSPPPFPRDDHAPLRHRVNPYADVPSLYDLYSQYGRRSPELVRFGDDVFRNGTGNFDQLPMDLPAGPDYVLGPGDGVNINLWGGISQRLRRVVDREGKISLPEAGSVQVSGRSLGDVQRLVQTSLQSQFRDVQVDVSLARLRTIRVYVVGDVERAGAYDISSLSTPLNAVFMAGGPTSRGSLRTLRHYRGNTLVQEVDVYDLLLHGIRNGVERLQSGDTVLVPPLGAEITVEGM